MSEAAWTKGPWLLVANTIYSPDDSTPRQSRFYASVQGNHCPAQELIANAKLIAAAPKLYDALCETATLLGILVSGPHLVEGDFDVDARVEDVLQQARAALAKARGDTP